MLNELYSIYQGLLRVGQDPTIKHTDIQAPGMGATFRVLLDSKGVAERIEFLSREQIKDTWSLGNGYKNQFPAIKLTLPLIPEAHHEYKLWRQSNKSADSDEIKKQFEILCQQYQVDLGAQSQWPSYRNKIVERQNQIVSLADSSARCVYELFERYLKSEGAGLDILRHVASLLVDRAKISANKDELKAIGNALFAEEVDANGCTKDNVKVTFLLDFLPFDDKGYGATSRRWVAAISDALLDNQRNLKNRVAICALTGDEKELVKKKFPSEKLSVIGNTILLAKNATTSGPTVQRYDQSGADGFPIAEHLSQKLAASLAFLTSETMEYKTWSKLASPVGSSSNLLLAYCMDDLNVNVVKLLTDEPVEDFEGYLIETEAPHLNLKGKAPLPTHSAVAIVELVVLDKANRKVNYSNITTLENIDNAARQWYQACQNIPEFNLVAWVDKKTNLVNKWFVSPQKLLLVSKQAFIRNGNESITVPGLTFADCMALYLSDFNQVKSFASRLLVRLTRQYQPLIARVSMSKHQYRLGDSALIKTSPKDNSVALDGICMIAVLLHKTGRDKESYMTETAFQLGQLCSAVDELHIGYCKHMRGGSIPNALLGNQIYGIALSDPTKAVSLLASRLKPYVSWAKATWHSDNKSNDDKAISNGLFAYRWLEKQALEVSIGLLESRLSASDHYKAELMLGYLSGRPFEGKKTQTDKESSQGEIV